MTPSPLEMHSRWPLQGILPDAETRGTCYSHRAQSLGPTTDSRIEPLLQRPSGQASTLSAAAKELSAGASELPHIPYFKPYRNPSWQLTNTPEIFPWGLPRRTTHSRLLRLPDGRSRGGSPGSSLLSCSLKEASSEETGTRTPGASPTRQCPLGQRHPHPHFQMLPSEARPPAECPRPLTPADTYLCAPTACRLPHKP